MLNHKGVEEIVNTIEKQTIVNRLENHTHRSACEAKFHSFEIVKHWASCVTSVSVSLSRKKKKKIVIESAA